MNYGPLIFLGAFFALTCSWFGLILKPQIQIGHLQQTNAVGTGATYPLARAGLARQGAEVYRASGCASCHSQQVGQTATVCDVILSDAGTNAPALRAALRKIEPERAETEATDLVAKLPKAILQSATKEKADSALKALKAAGTKSELWVIPTGPDIARGWGKRRTVAEDLLFDSPVMLGSQRIGPDLANVGSRLADANWQLRHLYDARSEVPGSTMPPYRFLFEKRKIERSASPEALIFPAASAPAPGYEIVPKPEAKALVAYLLSLNADAPLYEAPMTVASAPAVAATIAPAATATATNSRPWTANELLAIPASSTNSPAK